MSDARTGILEYKRFVDGLRAISVLAVVGYHIGLSALPGGFVGVDVFFVISGFLIITQINDALERGAFSFADFWARRAIRILPPYLLVILVCATVAPFVLALPDEFARLGEEMIASACMAANFLFSGQHGYFNRTADTKLLLHLWSLAVEEQFYVAAPLVMWGIKALHDRTGIGKLARWTPTLWPLAMLVASLGLCIRLSETDRGTAFHWMPLRAWEFILGGSIISVSHKARSWPRWLFEITGVTGLGLILHTVSAWPYGRPFPSYWAVLPAAGATLVIFACVAHPTALVARGLSFAPLVWIGLLSYGWYLWHWPLLVFVRQRNFALHSLTWDMAAAAFVASLGSHHLSNSRASATELATAA